MIRLSIFIGLSLFIFFLRIEFIFAQDSCSQLLSKNEVISRVLSAIKKSHKDPLPIVFNFGLGQESTAYGKPILGHIVELEVVDIRMGETHRTISGTVTEFFYGGGIKVLTRYGEEMLGADEYFFLRGKSFGPSKEGMTNTIIPDPNTRKSPKRIVSRPQEITHVDFLNRDINTLNQTEETWARKIIFYMNDDKLFPNNLKFDIYSQLITNQTVCCLNNQQIAFLVNKMQFVGDWYYVLQFLGFSDVSHYDDGLSDHKKLFYKNPITNNEVTYSQPLGSINTGLIFNIITEVDRKALLELLSQHDSKYDRNMRLRKTYGGEIIQI